MSTPHVYDQYRAAHGTEKRRLYSKHKTEIRAEARRRLEASEAGTTPRETSANTGHVFDRWQAASGAERQSLYSKHKTEIRAEAARRAEGSAK